MSSNAGRGRFKIVEPQEPNKKEILIGGIKNALERGETMEKAKRSFINAGYKPEEVEMAAKQVPSTTSKISQSTTPQTKTATSVKSKSPSKTAAPKQQKQVSKKFTIILIFLASLVVIGAILLGIFWDKII